MVVLYILLGIVLLVCLLLSLHIKLYLKVEDSTTVLAGFGPVLLQLTPQKERKHVDLSDFTYEKHQKRLLKEKKAAAKKAAKKAKKAAKKQEQKALKARAAEAARSIDEAAVDDKIASVTDILALVFEELPKLASYLKTEIRQLSVTVGGKDADAIGRTYGKIAALVPLLIELLANKTDFTPLKPDTVKVEADFIAPKTTCVLNIRLKLRLFSLVRIALHALVWLIRQKIAQSARNA